jgi:ferredoxin
MPHIRFNGGEDIEARAGHDLLGPIIASGQSIQYLCMSGSCRMCRVRIVSGGEHLEPAHPAETERCGPDARLACQAILLPGDGVVVVEQ